MKIFKDKLLLLIAISSIYSILLVALRIKISNSFYYTFLVWNLFLAFIPFGTSTLIKHSKWLQKSKYIFWSLLIIWLLFLPNAPYILTDLFHLEIGIAMPKWYDLLLVSSFAANGLLVFFVSINDIHQIVKERLSNFKAWIVTITVIFLSSFGIYLGRFLRWNSWDIIQKPELLFNDILMPFINPTQYPRTWGVTLGFGALFMISFMIFNYLISNSKLNNDI
jgi:uncharacterized membrane protein